MAGEFKLAGAYVEVNLRDNTSGDEKRIRARIEGESAVRWDTALNDPKNTEAVKKKVSAGKPVQFDTDLDDKLAQAKAEEFVAKRRTAVIDLDADIAKLRTKLEELNKKRGTSVEVDADIRKAEAELAALVARRRTVQLEVEAKTRPAEDDLARMAKRANAQFDALRFTALSVGLPAAAAAGAVGVGASLALVAGGFAALGTYIASTDEGIATKFTDLVDHVESDAKQMGGSFKSEVSGALDDVGRSWERLSPQVEAAVGASAPAVRILTGAVTDFAENAMPGVVTAVVASEAPLQGFRALVGQTGTGVGQFFANASAGAAGAGQGMALLGGIVQLLLARFGTLFANLAQGSAGPLHSLYVITDDITGALVDLTAQGSGAIGFLQGFTNTGTGAVAMLRLVLGLVSLLPPELTQLAGSLTASTMILSKLGVDAGKGFEGFADKVRAADGVGGKFKATVGGLAAGAFHPAALAAAALGIGLDILGQKQQEAAANAAAHAERERNLAQALRDSGGAIDGNVRSQAAYDLGNYKVADGVRNLNKDVLNLVGQQGLQQLQDAYLGNTQAGDTLKASLTGIATEHRKVATGFQAARAAFDDHINYVDGVAYAYDGTGFAAQQLLDIIGTEGGTFANASQDANANAQALNGVAKAAQEVTPAQYAAKVAAAGLSAAFVTLNQAAGDTAAKGQAVIDVLDRLAGRHKSEEEALQAWNDHLRGIGDSFKDLGLSKHTKDLIDNSGAVNTASEAGSKLQDTLERGAADMASYAQSLKDGGASASDITAKLGPMRDAFAQQLKQLGLNDSEIQTLLTHYGMVPADITTTLGLEGDDAAQKKVQQVVSQLKALPAGQSVKLSADDKPAADALARLGQLVVSLPDGTFQVFANTAEGKHAADVLIGNVNQLKGTVSVYGNTVPAGSAVANWQTVTNSTVGNTRTTTDIDPATGKVRQWKQTTDSTGAVTTTFATTDPATGAVRLWKQNADGTWAEVHAKADVAAAENALNNAARDRQATIRVVTVGNTSYGVGAGGASTSMQYGPRALGGIDFPGVVPMAAGGVLDSIPRIPSIATVVPPGTERMIGDNKRVPEAFVPIDPFSPRSQAITDELNMRMRRPRGSDGASIEQHFHIYPPADSDPQRIAASVSSQVGWSMRGV
ncbi:hypothetical protein ACFORO_25915 [Amycolatopsis halotolerans]|uniref:Uncharacterized protein n=1 Tax=Amycolatopsis halotolerans TaxID=330083 RepID=A0ABV7QP50_9PSEU